MSNYQKNSPHFIALIAGFGMFLSTLDSGIINIAIPTLIPIFHTQLNTAIWTVTLYTLILSASIMLFGQLADRYGRLKIYMAGLSLFAIASFLCGLSPTIESLIAFRTLQGLAAAMMQATAIAIITSQLEKEAMTKALGILAMLMGLGPTMGPVLGGFILSTIGWQWIFWLNIPICLYGLYGCRQLKTSKEVLHTEPLHYLNLFFFGVSLFLLLLSMNQINDHFSIAVTLFFIALITFSLHIYLENKSQYPTIQYQLFKNLTFTAPMLGIMAFGAATAIAFIIPPFFFQKLRHYEAWQVGLISLSAPLGIVITARISARLAKSIGTHTLMLIGMLLMAISLIVLTQINIDWSPTLIFSLLLLYGIGGGFFMTPCIIDLTSQLPAEKQAFISSLIRMLQNAAIAFGAAGSAMLINMQSTATSDNLLLAIQHAWWLAAGVIILALIAILLAYFDNQSKS